MTSPISARSMTIPEDGCSSGAGLATPTLVGSETLTAFQRRMLLNNWQHLTKTGSGGIGSVMFQKFLSKRPETRKLFTKASVVSGFTGESANLLPEHIRLLIDLLDKAINSLEDLSEVGQTCVQYGSVHAHMHGVPFDVEYWDKFGQTMLESVTQLEVVRKHKELVKAWMILISFLIDKMRQGYATGLRRLKFQKSRPVTYNHENATSENMSNETTGSSSQSKGSHSSGEKEASPTKQQNIAL